MHYFTTRTQDYPSTGQAAGWLTGGLWSLSALLGLIGLLLLSPLHAQPPIQWERTLGGNEGDALHSVLQTADGGYVLGGTSASGKSGDKSEESRGATDYWIVKLDANGNKLWDRTLGGSGGDVAFSLVQTTDGGYMLGGTSASGKSGDKSEESRGATDYWIVKLDANGNKLWDRTLGGSGGDIAFTLVQTTDRGYMLGGTSASGKSGDKSEESRGATDYWIVKLDANGNKLWDRTLGGSGGDVAYSLVQTTDGGYMLGGYSASGKSGDKSEESRGTTDYWIVKLDAAGNKLWDKTLGGSGGDFAYSLVQTTDGGYMLGGYSASGKSGDKSEESRGDYDFWVVRLDGEGNKLWDRTLGGVRKEYLRSISQTSDGGFILGGESDSFISGDKSEASRGSTDYWIVKLDANGTKQWDKTLGGNREDALRSLQQTVDGGFVLGGYSNSSISGEKSEASRGYNDFWVVKLGCPIPGFTVSSQQACLGALVTFTDASGSVGSSASYVWDLDGDGSADYSGRESFAHTYTAAGTYAARLTVTEGSCVESFTMQIEVLDPTQGGSVSGSATVCAGSNSTLLRWVDPNEKIDDKKKKESSSSSSSPAPEQSPSPAAPSAPANPAQEAPLASSSPIQQWQSSTDGGNTWTDIAGTANATTYTATNLTQTTLFRTVVQSGACEAAFSEAATVTVHPASAGGTVTGGATVCTGSNSTMLALDGQVGTVKNWQSSTDGGNTWADIPGTENANGYTATGLTQTTSFRAVVQNGACAPAFSEAATVTVTQPPVVDAGSCRTIYLGYGDKCATLTATADQPNLSYAWSDGLSGSSVQVCPTATTTYTVTATNAAGCQSSATVSVQVIDVRCGNKNDKVVVCHNGKELCVAPSAVQAHLAHGDKLGSCNALPCGGGQGSRQGIAEELSELPVELAVEAYPNPTEGHLTLRVRTSYSGAGIVEVLDPAGRAVKGQQVELQAGDNALELDVAAQPSGLYLLRVRDAAGRQGAVRLLRK